MRKITLLAACVTLSGCAALNRPEVTINAISAPDANQFRIYVMAPANEKMRGLEFDQYIEQVQRALETKGFIKVNDIKKANVVIGLSVNIGDAKTATHSGVIPMWGQTGYQGAQTYGSYSGNQYQSSTYYTPSYGVTGYAPYSSSVTFYPIGFALEAWAKTADGKDTRQVWNIVVTAGSRSPDLRSAFPKMLNAALPYIAQDTQGIIKIRAQNDK